MKNSHTDGFKFQSVAGSHEIPFHRALNNKSGSNFTRLPLCYLPYKPHIRKRTPRSEEIHFLNFSFPSASSPRAWYTKPGVNRLSILSRFPWLYTSSKNWRAVSLISTRDFLKPLTISQNLTVF